VALRDRNRSADALRQVDQLRTAGDRLPAASVSAAQTPKIVDVPFREDGGVASFDDREPGGAAAIGRLVSD
jgi:hypothetical protein